MGSIMLSERVKYVRERTHIEEEANNPEMLAGLPDSKIK